MKIRKGQIGSVGETLYAVLSVIAGGLVDFVPLETLLQAGLGIVLTRVDDKLVIAAPGEKVFTVAGELSVSGDPVKIWNASGVTRTITKVFLGIGTGPTGAAVIVDVNINGTTCFTTQSNRPQIAAGATTGQTTTIQNASWADGQALSIDIDQIGSTIKGSNLTVIIFYN